MYPKWSRNSLANANEGEVLTVALSSDDRYLVSSGRDRKIRVFDIRANRNIVKEFTGHRDTVTSLCFQKGTSILYSSSNDRCIKLWDLKEMGYIETLFGLQVSC